MLAGLMLWTGCRPPVDRSALPDPALTPGATMNVSVSQVCASGYTRGVRNVSAEVKREVYAEYGRVRQQGICCEVDHLIPLELGGSNGERNLWPQPYDIAWNARAKDRLERRLHSLVCSGKLDLGTAQKAIAYDWVAAYEKYVGE